MRPKKPALSQPLQLKQAGGDTPLCLGWQEPLTRSEQTHQLHQSSPVVDLSNCPCTPESRHLQLVVCRSWASTGLSRFK
ncbi:hypothetical protein J6590_017087 [Homalodisca vitripennis]|nr:hypothetical protein J6590_017087 [Homalodisca vitripennis]